MKRMAMLIAAMMASYALAEQIEISLPDPATVRLDWQAIPGQTYRVMAKTNLLDQSWQDAVPGGLVAGSVIGAYTEPVPAKAAFFRVQKEDTTPPEIESLIPVADAIAVPSNATVSITVTDETGIDTNTIVLTVAGWKDMTLASPYLTYDNSTIVFTPPDILGQAGETITNILTVADTLGHTLSDHTWTFQLARPADADDDFLPLTAPSQGQGIQTLAAGVPETRIRTLANVQPLDATAEYHIVSVTSNTVVFSYQGDPPAMPEGKRLVSFDAAHPFYRRATSNLVDGAQNQITVWTVDIALTDLATEGSLSSAAFMSADPAPLGMRAASSGLNLLHVEFGDDLSGTVLFEDGGLKLHLPQASWGFVGDVDVAFDLFFAELRSLDASAKGTLTLDLSPEALFYQAVNGDGEFPLVQPVTKVFGAMVGPVPVWVEVIMELNAGYEYSASVSVVVNTRVHAEKELTFYVKLRQNQWTHGVHNPPIVLEADPIYWQLEGEANAKVYVQPKLTVLVYSLAGLWADVKPYAEFDGRYQLNPVEYDLGLYLGMSSTLGIESRIWYSAWGNKPEWELFDLKWPLWAESYPSGTPPVFLLTLSDRLVSEGERVVLTAPASSTPSAKYRWYFNDSRIVGETSHEFVIPRANADHVGRYAVEAYNDFGSVVTSCAILLKTLDSGLVAFYPMNGNVDDYSAWNNHGINNGAYLVPDRHGVSNHAYAFDGNTHIAVPDSTSLDLTSQLTLTAWICVTNSRPDLLMGVVSKPRSASGTGYRLGLRPGYLPEMGVNDVVHNQGVVASNSVPVGVWTHIAGTLDGDEMCVYVNGILATRQIAGHISLLNSSRPLYIGTEGISGSGDRSYRGLADEVRVYNRALTPQEIMSLFLLSQ